MFDGSAQMFDSVMARHGIRQANVHRIRVLRIHLVIMRVAQSLLAPCATARPRGICALGQVSAVLIATVLPGQQCQHFFYGLVDVHSERRTQIAECATPICL